MPGHTQESNVYYIVHHTDPLSGLLLLWTTVMSEIWMSDFRHFYLSLKSGNFSIDFKHILKKHVSETWTVIECLKSILRSWDFRHFLYFHKRRECQIKQKQLSYQKRQTAPERSPRQSPQSPSSAPSVSSESKPSPDNSSSSSSCKKLTITLFHS